MSLQRAKHWLQKIQQLDQQQTIKIMNVCGGHERSISNAGLRSLLPDSVELIAGPGCPVCVCPEEDVYLAIQLALHEEVMLLAFGDMLRVPVNVSKLEVRTLEQARAQGADVRAIASPRDAIAMAQNNQHKTIVFFAAGFETTMAPVAAMMAQGLPANLFLLLSGRQTWPAINMLLNSSAPGFDGLIAPGHVATVMGPEQWQFVVDQHKLPVAVAGFEADSLLAALYSVLRQKQQERLFLDNCYSAVVQPGGNKTAQQFLKTTMVCSDSNWRGIGIIPASGYELAADYCAHDARLKFPGYTDKVRNRAGEMPAGCDCAKVVLGKIYPDQCRLYGVACQPETPVGPCMVSDEGACQIWWQSQRRQEPLRRENVAL